MHRSFFKMGGCHLAIAVASVATPAMAQETGADQTGAGSQGDIVVTAQRRNERMQDVPASISAVSGDSLATQQISNLTQAMAKMPNVQVSLPYGEGGPPNFAIRGISSTDFSLNVSKPVAVNFNDSIRNLQLFEVQPLFDIERIEVLRGPQGTLYGRNATAGAVNIITQSPKFDSDAYVTLGYGNFNTFKAEGAANQELISGTLAARIAVYYTNDDGIYKNKKPGVGDGMETDMFNIRPSLKFQSGDFEATLRFSHVESTGRNNIPKPYHLTDAGPATVWTANDANVGFYDNYTDDVGRHELRTDGVNLAMSWSPSSYTFQSVTSYDWGRMYDNASATGTEVSYFEATSTAEAKQFVQELRVLSTYDGALNWQGGVSYYRDQVDVSNINNFIIDGFVDENSFQQKRDGFAGYVGADLELMDSLTLHGGVRRSNDRLRAINYTASEGLSGISFAGVDARRRFHNTSFSAGADWKVAPDVLFYGTFKQAYRMGALNGQNYADENGVGAFAPPEKARAFEAGLKSEFFNRMLTLNLSVSNTQYRNQQAIDFSTGIAVLVSLPAARVNALEAEATLRPFDGFSLSGNLGLTDAKYTKSPSAYPDLKGNRLGLASKVSGAIDASYDIVKLDAGTLNVRGTASYRSKYYSNFQNTESLAMRSYWLFDAGLGWDTDRYTVRAGAKNVFNKKYWTTGASYQYIGLDAVQRGLPRRLTIDATYKF